MNQGGAAASVASSAGAAAVKLGLWSSKKSNLGKGRAPIEDTKKVNAEQGKY